MIMFDFLKKLFGSAVKVPAQPAEPAKCGCGRSPTGLCVGLHKLSDEEWATNDANPNKVTKKPTVPKATTRAAKIEGDKKPAVKAKTARKPRAPKA